MSSLIFKIVSRKSWADAQAAGFFNGASIDLSDGFIHFSDPSQVVETAARHFFGQTDLLLVAYNTEIFGAALKWEKSRGGALFPHLYGTLDPAKALWVKLLIWNGTSHEFPKGWNT